MWLMSWLYSFIVPRKQKTFDSYCQEIITAWTERWSKDDWDSYGSDGIPRECLDNALSFVEANLEELKRANFSLGPSPDTSICTTLATSRIRRE